MPLPTKSILGVLADNLAHRGSVLPLPAHEVTAWSRGLDLPRGGETILYTGHMYQLIPWISAMAEDMVELEDSWITRLSGAGRMANRLVNLASLMSPKISAEDRKQCNRMLHNIARLLMEAGVSFGYLYEDEMYSGTLVYDHGMDEVFGRHARKVTEVLKKNGVRKLITVDPHTTNILREVYPQFVDDFDLEVASWLEILEQSGYQPPGNGDQEVVLHDSCVYARYEKLVDQPRTLLARAGITAKEPTNARAATFCCGGPIESLFPGKAQVVARKRMEQLREAGPNIVTMCPICWVNLRKEAAADTQVRDLSDILAGTGSADGP